MKAGIFFTGTGPIAVVTSYDSFTNPDFVKKFYQKGIKKFIAYEVSFDTLKEKYGQHFDVVMQDIKQEDDCRVLDFDGHHIFGLFSFKELGQPLFYE